jgi:hypothetical protein
MKRLLLWISGACAIAILLISLAGMYKFNYLANKPGYDCDGNRIEETE